MRILRGEVPSSISVKPLGPSPPVYDWRELRRWGISESRLPPGSIVQFRRPTFWDQYRWYIIAALMIIVVQAMLIVGLLLHRARRRRAEAQLRERGKLVGLDVEMAHILARSLGVGLEFVAVDRTKLFQQLNEGYCDIVMSGIVVTPERAEAVSLSTPYMEETLALVVQDYRRSEFSSREALQKLKAPKLAILDVPYFISFVREHLPKAQLVTVNSAAEFFESKGKTLDGFIYTAEGGSAWSLLYPEYTIVVLPSPITLPVSYVIARGDRELVDYVNALVELKKGDGTLKKLYNYWVLGRFAADTQPRWSVIRNVLHWVE